MKGIVDHNHTIVYTLTTVTPGTPFLFLFVISLFNFICVIFGVKYTKIFGKFPRCSNMKEKMQNLRNPDVENLYQYIEGDYQYKHYFNLQNFLHSVFGTRSISESMFTDFTECLNNQ